MFFIEFFFRFFFSFVNILELENNALLISKDSLFIIFVFLLLKKCLLLEEDSLKHFEFKFTFIGGILFFLLLFNEILFNIKLSFSFLNGEIVCWFKSLILLVFIVLFGKVLKQILLLSLLILL